VPGAVHQDHGRRHARQTTDGPRGAEGRCEVERGTDDGDDRAHYLLRR
jgi:hypothetical protein